MRTIEAQKRFLMIAALLACGASSSQGSAQSDVRPARPNIIFVLADDLGWAELGCYGNGFNETQHLDQLATEGMRFTQAYAAAPVCSPYRAALLTAQYPARIGILDYLRPNSSNGLSTDHVTLPEILQRNGYATGMIGKWHLTGYEHHGAEHEVKPRDHGFGWDFAREVKSVGNGANFWPYVFRKQKIRWTDIPDNRLGDQEYLVDRMNLEAADFVQRHKDRPFFLYLSHYATHTILHGKPELVEKFRRKHLPGKSTRSRCYLCQDQGHPSDSLHHWAGDHNPHLAAMLASVDKGIGIIRAKLDELGISDNTIIIFTSDNGGETNVTSNAPLRGGKSELYEGGIRVPLIVCWPGRTPAGSVCKQATVNVDFYPTLLAAAGLEADASQTLDGVSTMATWKDPAALIERDTLYWHYPLDRPHFLGGQSSGAIREGDWKLMEFFDTGEAQLYSLADDPSEQHSVASDHPQVVQRLKTKLAAWRESVGARTPSARR
jgi:arylsulfatase A-like enzyme